MWAGVLKSGSPRLKSMMFLPSALSCRAFAAAAKVAEGCTAAAILETGNIEISTRVQIVACIKDDSWKREVHCAKARSRGPGAMRPIILSPISPGVRGACVYLKNRSISACLEGLGMVGEAATRDLPRVPWTRRHLLGLEELSRDELLAILDTADRFSDAGERRRKKRTNLSG